MRHPFARAWALASGLFLIIALGVPSGTALGSGDYEINGIIESLPASGLIGDWVVSGTTVHVTSSTDIDEDDGPAVVGAPVEVRGDLLDDGTVDADEVEVDPSNSGGDDDSDDDDNSGPGSGDDDDDNSGPGSGDDDDDNSGPGSGDDDDDNSGPGSGDDDDSDDDDGDDDEIHGTIEQLPASGLVGDWVVSGRIVHVTPETTIEQEHGAVEVGAPVEVHGVPSGGEITATRIEVYPSNGGGQTGGEAKFFGTVESMAADLWIVSGRAVRVGESTVVEREHGVEPGVGSYVEVEGALLADGSLQARKIEVRTAGTTGDAPGDAPSREAAAGYIELKGRVEAMPAAGLTGEWTVSGRVVHVTESTRVQQKKPARVGATVEIIGNQRPDGSIDAGALEIKGGKGGRRSLAKVYGTIQSLPATGLVGAWVVSGRAVVVSDLTVVKQELGAAVVGALVEVKGTPGPDDSIAATVVEVKDGSGAVGGSGYIEFRGTVESMPAGGLTGEWVVSGRRVHVAAGVTVRGTVRVGSIVEVEGSQRTDGSVDASKIHFED